MSIKNLKKYITVIIMGSFFFLFAGSSIYQAAGTGSGTTPAGIQFVLDDDKTTDSSGGTSSTGDSSSSGATIKPNTSDSGGKKPYFPQAGEITGGIGLAVIGLILIAYVTKKYYQKQN